MSERDARRKARRPQGPPLQKARRRGGRGRALAACLMLAACLAAAACSGRRATPIASVQPAGVLAQEAASTPSPLPATEAPTIQATLTATLAPTTAPSATAPPATPTRESTATPRATVAASATALPKGMLYGDDFSDNHLGWNEIKTADGGGAVQDGQYVLRVRSPGVFLVASPHQAPAQVDDLRLRYTVTLVEGGRQNAALGGLCRYTDAQNFYAFWITPAGYYSIEKSVLGRRSDLLGWHRSPAIRPDLAANEMDVSCAGTQLRLEVNGTLLAKIDDSSLSTGGIGLTVGAFDQGGEVVGTFDNLSVWQAEAPAAQARPTARATAAPTASATPQAASAAALTVVSTVRFGVRLSVWGPKEETVDIGGGQTARVELPRGEYGWQMFANSCRLAPTDSLRVEEDSMVITIVPVEGECGYAAQAEDSRQ